MPRNAPDEVKEHRLTLGSFERGVLTPMLKAQARQDNIKTASNAITGLLAAGAIAGVGFLGVQAWLKINDLKEDAKEMGEKLKDGASTVVFGPKSVKTNKPPSGGPMDIYRDPNDPMKRKNPWHGVPFVGSAFGLGMWIGEKTDPFS